MADTTNHPTTSKPSQKGFSSISKLMKDSWERVKRTWKQLVLMYIILIAVIALLFGATGAFFVTSYLANISSPDAIGGLIVMGIIAVLLLSVVVIAISSVFGSSILLAVSESKEFPTLGSKISRGFQLFFPMLLASLITVFMVYGGLGLFIIPGIAIAILTSFTAYEIVFTQNRTVTAIRNSVTIVQQNFGELFTRVGVIILISIGIGIVMNILDSATGTNGTEAGISSLISLIVQPVFSLFTLAYYYQVYVEARNATNFSKPASITWMWLVAALGWVVGIFLIISMSRFIGNMMDKGFNGGFDSNYDYSESAPMMESGSSEEFDTEAFLDAYGEDMTEEEKEAFRQSIEKADEMINADQNALENEGAL